MGSSISWTSSPHQSEGCIVVSIPDYTLVEVTNRSMNSLVSVCGSPLREDPDLHARIPCACGVESYVRLLAPRAVAPHVFVLSSSDDLIHGLEIIALL